MKSIVIHLKEDADVQLISEMLKKMNINFQVLTNDALEDATYGKMLLEVDRSEKVSREKIMKKLCGE